VGISGLLENVVGKAVAVEVLEEELHAALTIEDLAGDLDLQTHHRNGGNQRNADRGARRALRLDVAVERDGVEATEDPQRVVAVADGGGPVGGVPAALGVPAVAEVELDAEEVLPLILGDAVGQAVAVDVGHLDQGAGEGADDAGAERPERAADVDGGAAGEVEGIEGVERREAAERRAQRVDDVLAAAGAAVVPGGQ